MVGWREVVRYKASSVADAAEWWAELAANVVSLSELDDAPAGAGFLAFGSFTFDPHNSAATSTLIIPEVVLGHERGRRG